MSHEAKGNKILGGKGERAAAELLEGKGYRILERNYACRIGEIDLIAQKGGLLVFVEVKARRSGAYGHPCEAVHARKQRYIRRVASWYLTENGRLSRLDDDCDMRFDVIEAYAKGGVCELRHIEGAFW